jgi:hypothetical protein
MVPTLRATLERDYNYAYLPPTVTPYPLSKVLNALFALDINNADVVNNLQINDEVS